MRLFLRISKNVVRIFEPQVVNSRGLGGAGGIGWRRI